MLSMFIVLLFRFLLAGMLLDWFHKSVRRLFKSLPLPISEQIQRWQIDILYYFPPKLEFDISCKLSSKETICIGISNLIFWKISAEILIKHA